MFGANKEELGRLNSRVYHLEKMLFLLTANLSTCLDGLREPRNADGELRSDIMMDQLQLSFDECYLADPRKASHYIVSRTGSKRVNT